MKIDDFSGGIQTRLSPRQLAGSQSVACENVDFKTTDIVPFRKHKSAAGSGIQGESFTFFKGQVFGASSSIVSTNDPEQPSFFSFLDSLYVLKKISATQKLYRYVDLNGVSTLVPAGYQKEQVQTSVTAIPFGASTTHLRNYTGALPAASYAYYQGGPGFPHSYVSDPSFHSSLNSLLRLLVMATSNSVAGNYEILLTVDGTNARELTQYIFVPPQGDVTYIDYLVRYTIRIKKEGNEIFSGSTEHGEITVFLGQDYITSPIGLSVNTATGEPTDPLTVLFKERRVIESSKHEYTYLITLYSSVIDFETSFMEAIHTVEAHEAKSVQLDITFNTIGDLGVNIDLYDKVRIYRLGNGATVGTLLEELSTAAFSVTGSFRYTTWIDSVLTADRYLSAGRLFDTLETGEMPQDITHGLQIGNRVMLASGNKLYGSELGNQDSFPVANIIEFNEPIVALAESSRGLLVFFASQTYLVRQRKGGRFSKTLVSKDQGCTTYRSIQQIGNIPYWFSKDGFCTLIGNRVRILSKANIKDFKLSEANPLDLTKVLCSGQADERYYAVLNYDNGNSRVFVYDMSYGRRVPYYLLITGEVTNFANLDGQLYCVIGHSYFAMFGTSTDTEEAFEAYKYVTGLVTDGAITKRKTYDDVYFFSLTAYPTVVTLTNEKGKVMGVKTIASEGLHNLKIMAGRDNAYGIQFSFEGKATIAELEYKIKGRDNGR